MAGDPQKLGRGEGGSTLTGFRETVTLDLGLLASKLGDDNFWSKPLSVRPLCGPQKTNTGASPNVFFLS